MIVEDDPDLRILVEVAANRARAFSSIVAESDGESALARIRELSAVAGHPACPPLRATSLSLRGEPADIGKG
jgi:hypothetical protein